MKAHFGNNLFVKLKMHSSAWEMSFFFAYTEEKLWHNMFLHIRKRG